MHLLKLAYLGDTKKDVSFAIYYSSLPSANESKDLYIRFRFHRITNCCIVRNNTHGPEE